MYTSAVNGLLERKHQCSPPSLARPSVSSAAPPLSISSVSAPRSCSLHFWDAGISGTRVARQRLKETQKLTTYLRAAGKSSESLLWWKERETVSNTGKNGDQLKGEKILPVIFAFANHILHILFMGLMFTCVVFMCFACDTEKDKIINRSWKRSICLFENRSRPVLLGNRLQLLSAELLLCRCRLIMGQYCLAAVTF